MQNIDRNILKAKNNPDLLENIIKDYEKFILASASEVAKHYITKSDDEWSIALIAFYDAVKSFDSEKGNFISYAKLMIRSRLIDYFRSQNRHANQISIELVEENKLKHEDRELSVREEIEALGQLLDRYGFSFSDLARNSPKAAKTRNACKKAIRFLIDKPILIINMQRIGMLPIKIIETNTQIPRKIIERHRKYIITAAEILTGDYPNLKEYFDYVLKEE